MRRGFTLVEMAIVLVVIGLLIGGVLVGSSMIQTTKVGRLVRDLGKYEIAVNNFYSNYKYYPGDAPLFTPPGRGNRDIGHGGPSGVAPCSASNPDMSNLEMYQVWAHLAQAKMIDIDYGAYKPDLCTGGTHSSDYTLAVNMNLLSPTVELDSEAQAVGGQKKYPIGASQAAGGNFNFFFYVNRKDTLSLEAKMHAEAFTDEKRVGLVNYNGMQNCNDASYAVVTCDDAAASVGYLGYYLQPL